MGSFLFSHRAAAAVGRAGRGAGAPAPAVAPGTAAAAGRGAVPGPAAAPARGGGGRRGRGGPAATGPIAYTVQVSTDGTTWGGPVAAGTGPRATTIATFRPVQAKFIRVTQTARATTGEIWAIQQVRVYATRR